MSQTILIVDDSATVRQVTRWVLESEGHRALEASTLREAAQQLESNAVTTILVDYQLPDGPSVPWVQQLRSNARYDGLRVIVLHGNFHPFDADSAPAAGVTGLLKKPFRSQPLLDTLQLPVGSSETAPIATPIPTPAATSSVEDAMQAASAREEDLGYTEPHHVLSGARELSSGLSAPPSAPQTSANSGMHRAGATTQSGLHRLPPPPGRPTVPGVPRVPTGQMRTITEDSVANIRPPQRPTDVADVPPVPPPVARPVMVSQPQHVTARREMVTTEVEPIPANELAAEASITPAATSSPISEEQLRQIVAEMLPAIARQALAGLLKTELNEQVVRMGVMKRVSQFLDEDLPRYAQSAIERRLNDRKD